MSDSRVINRRLVRSYLSSVFSISLMLLLMGFAGLIVINAKSVSNYFKENMAMSAILTIEASEDEAKKLISEITAKKYVKGIDYISKEEGVLEMQKMLGEDFLDIFVTNPIPISLDINIAADYVSKDSIKFIQEDLLKFSIIDELIYQESLVDALNQNLEKLGVGIGVFVIFLLIMSFWLISNTIKLDIYSRRFNIHTMRLVGATKGFITKPFIEKAFFQGLIAAAIAGLIMVGVLALVKKEFPLLFSIFDYWYLLYLLTGIILIGILICVLNTIVIVRKLISLKNDDLYE